MLKMKVIFPQMVIREGGGAKNIKRDLPIQMIPLFLIRETTKKVLGQNKVYITPS